MAQKINLNASPYYDDYDSEKNFHKVLYKPGFPVQARELTQQQSILQNQVEKFGDNIFKDGSVVIPGAVGFDIQNSAVKLNDTNFNVDVSLYVENFIGKKIKGSESGIEAIVKSVLLPDGGEVENVTLYVNYLSADNNSQFNSFTDGESLSSDENVVYGNTTITANTPFASLISVDATAVGSAAFISKGVYFVRGFFVNVSDQSIILDPYTNNPSYRVGLQIDELIVNAKEDNTLFDNAKGFSNFAAPGADRLKIQLTLTKKALTDRNDTDFIELLRVDEGKLKIIETKSNYNKIRDYIAGRTYDESGDYSVTPFQMGIFNSLNDNLGNNGLFFEDEKTEQENTPSDDLMCLKISAGEVYVRGYDIEKTGTTIIDVDKPRDVGIRTDIGVGFEMGNILKLNNVTKSIAVQGSVVKLFDNFNSTGTNIGSARVYSFNLEDAAYDGTASTNWELRLFDGQTNTDLVLNQSVSNTELPAGSFIKGKNSGASGFAVGAGGGSTLISVNQTSGVFLEGEQIQINGVDFPRTIGIKTEYTAQNIRSIEDGNNLKGDVVIEKFNLPNAISEVSVTAGIATASVSEGFKGLRKGSLVVYKKSGSTLDTFNKVSSINSNGTITLVATTGVAGVYDGSLTSGTETVNMFLGAPVIRGTGALYVPLNPNISDVDLTKSKIKITKQISKNASSNQLTINTSDITDVSDVIFDTFDQERYTMSTTSNGSPLAITNDTFSYGTDGASVTFTDIATNDSKTVNVSLIKNKVKSKLKQYNRSQVLNVTRSKNAESGSVAGGNGGSIADGLTFDARYGLRVQDEEISLNYPDVAKFLAVYESTNTSAPVLDRLTFTSTVAVQNNAIIGENIISKDSNIIARVVSSPAANVLEIVYLTSGKFQTGELVHFEESDINTNIESITIGKYKNITNSFTLDKGQRDQYYDYSKLVRNQGVSEPSAQLLVVFDYYSVSSDDGDVFTVRSYDEERFSKDIPNIGEFNIRATDTFDFRPRVSVYNPSTDTGSPFEFSNRDFSGTSVLHYFTPNESSTASYSFYLGRQDTVYMNKFGEFVYEKGVSSLNPKPPSKVGELMELATISLPPYLYNPQDAILTLIDNRRFTMRDIGDIEDRVTNLEETTTLSLLEVSAQTLQIQDEEGKNRFKSGLFADPFKNYNFIDENSLIQINPESEELIPFRTRNTLASQIKPAEITISSELDFNTDFPLFDTNVKKTGNVVTLNYDEVEWITQPYATEIINVNPYELPIFNGEVDLDPAFDRWTRSVQLADRNVRQTGTTTTQRINLGGNVRRGQRTFNLRRFGLGNRERIRIFGRDVRDTRTRTNTVVTRQNNLVSTSDDDFIRSRNIQFISEGFVDFVETYVFFDGQKIFDVIPKLLEITPTKNGSASGSNGVYKIGEEVHALNEEGNVIMKFRLCQPDHKSGKYNNPSETYFSNPYTSGLTEISSNYSQSSTVLNVDTKALAEEAQGKYFGYVTKNAQLVGQESGATSYVKDIRLITDAYGEVIGSCFIRNPNMQPAPPVKIQTGVKEFKVTTSPTNENVEPTQKFGLITAESEYDSSGTIEEWQTTVTTTVNTTNFIITGRRQGRRRRHGDPLAQTFIVGGNVEAPSAQDANKDKNGAFITAVEVYFATVDTVANSPIRCEIRSTIADARPSMEVIGRSRTLKPKGTDANGNEVTLIEADPNEASKATKFTFPEPIYLEAGRSYSFVLLAPRSVAYNVWTARHGGIAVNPSTITGANPGSSIIYSTQYGAGAIFKSQNGALWTEDQHQDITFKLYKAKFTSQSGSAFFHNPDLDESNGYETSMIDNPLFTLSKTGSIGITTNQGMGSLLSAGRKICGGQNTSTAVITGVGCSALTLNASPNLGGSNYETDSDVETFAITGRGSGLKLNITGVDSNGAITSVNTTPVVRGNGYQVGDIVGIVTSTVGEKGGTGTGARITIASIDGIDTLFLTNIQAGNGSNGFQDGTQIKYFDNSGTAVAMGATGAIRSGTVAFDGGAHAGNVMFVEHFNHGMHSTSNKVKISDIESDVEPTVITADLSKTETSIISVASTSQFTNFEGIAVGAANTGYVKIGSEIIGYESVGTGVLNIGNSQRGVDNTVVIDHSLNSVVRKHEISGVSIRRLETTDTTGLSVVGYPRQPIDLDTYHVTFDRSKNGTDRSTDTATSPELSFSRDEFLGGSNVKMTQNLLYSAIVPRYDVLTPTGVEGATTGIQASIRSVSGTSASGNEISFLDNGFQDVQLNSINSFDDVKLVASKINENQYLSGLPSNKSFTTILNLSSNDENLSPIISLSSGSETEFISHRLDRPVNLENYDSDGRVNSINDDPHAAIYLSNRVNLKNPATSLKVILSAFRPESSDFRVLYSLVRPDSNEVEQSFELFPGFKNTTKTNNDGFVVDDESKNDGRPDTIVTPSLDDQFKEYQFTVDNLPEFTGFSIKIVMSGTNQALPPRIKELRAIAVK